MLLKHFFTEKIAHSSYLLAGQNVCAVIDPQRDTALYTRAARSLGVQITHIIQTHLHADFVSGHMDLAAETGAAIYAARSARCSFDHIPVSEGDQIKLEDMELQVLETPGHTPEHISIIVVDRSRSEQPVGVFVGDTLFVGDVGRPDLFPNQSETLAGQLFDSLHTKLLQLPDYCEVYPAHGAGSLCGRSMGAKWVSTIGYERHCNQALKLASKEAFIQSLTQDMPPAPDHFRRCSDINRQGPATAADLPPLEALTTPAFAAKRQEGSLVLDVRNYLAFGGRHIPEAWHLDLHGNFPTFAGWVLPPDRDILLVSDSEQQAREALIWARRVGIDRITGYLERGMPDWMTAGLPTAAVPQLSACELNERLSGRESFVLLDVRSLHEYDDHHIPGAINIPAADLRTHASEIDPSQPIVVMCSSGNRSSLGASILKQNGLTVMNLAGGLAGYSAAGYTSECRACVVPHGSRFFSALQAHP